MLISGHGPRRQDRYIPVLVPPDLWERSTSERIAENLCRKQDEAMHEMTRFMAAVLVIGAICTFALTAQTQVDADNAAEMPPMRAIPGITAEDQFPGACVDCHIDYADMNMDTRISTLMVQWNEEVEPALLEAARAVSGPGIELRGVHPRVDAALNDIPAACIRCHGSGAENVPPLVPLLHSIHLGTEGEAVFLRVFQGECTHCHKLDSTTGIWYVPSGQEP